MLRNVFEVTARRKYYRKSQPEQKSRFWDLGKFKLPIRHRNDFMGIVPLTNRLDREPVPVLEYGMKITWACRHHIFSAHYCS